MLGCFKKYLVFAELWEGFVHKSSRTDTEWVARNPSVWLFGFFWLGQGGEVVSIYFNACNQNTYRY